MNRVEIINQIKKAVEGGIILDAKVQLDIGLSGELHGRTAITVSDLLAALDVDTGMRSAIFQDIEKERSAQDQQWGGPDHDREHDMISWGEFIVYQLEKLDHMMTPEQFRERMIKVAALAVAAIEAG